MRPRAAATVSETGSDCQRVRPCPRTCLASVTRTRVDRLRVNWNATSETLTLSGTDTLADYQSVLDTVTFNNTSINPTDYGSDPTRTVTWVLNNGGSSNSLSTAVTETVSIAAVNQPPTLASVATTANYTQGGGAVTLSSAVSVSDPDQLDLTSATVSIVGGNFAGDVLNATGTTSISVSYNSSTETLTLYQMSIMTLCTAGLLTLGFRAPQLRDALMIALAGVGNGIAQFWWTRSLSLAPPSAVVPFNYLSLVWAMILGFAVWGDVPTPGLLVGSAIVVASGLYILWRETVHRRRRAVPAPQRG